MNDDDLTAEEQAALESEQTAAPPPEEAAPVEDVPAPQPEAEAEPAKPKFVPVQALEHHREKRTEAENKIAELEARLAAYEQSLKPRQPAEDEMPDPVLEPDKFKTWMRAEREKATQPYQEIRQQTEQQRRVYQQFQTLKGYAEQNESTFKTEHQDYDDALNFMREREQQRLAIMGYPPHEIPQVMAQSEIGVVALAAQRGQNPAAMIYNLALMNGFTPKQAAAQANEGEKIARLATVQAQTRSTNGMGGAPKPEKYSLSDLANMSEKQLAKLEKDDPDAFEALLKQVG